MKHFISLKIIFLLFFLSSKSQDLYTLSPYLETKTLVKEFMINSKIESENKDKYIISLPPNGCPRCESVINPLINKIINQSDVKKEDFILIVDYHNEQAAKEYLKKNFFEVDKIIMDANSTWFSFFFIIILKI
jgi:hypothetical protein